MKRVIFIGISVFALTVIVVCLNSPLRNSIAVRTGFTRAFSPPTPSSVPYPAGQSADWYSDYFNLGYSYAWNVHPRCPPNPTQPEYEAIIRGWIDGFKVGASHGGNSSFPSRYLAFEKLSGQ
jgi:hypothetical protein